MILNKTSPMTNSKSLTNKILNSIFLNETDDTNLTLTTESYNHTIIKNLSFDFSV